MIDRTAEPDLEARVLACLADVMDVAAGPDPSAGANIIATGRVEAVRVEGGVVQVALRARREERAAAEALGREVERRVAALEGVARATVVLTSHREVSTPAAEPLASGRAEPHASGRAEPHASGRAEPHAPGRAEPHASGRAEPHASGRAEPHASGRAGPGPAGRAPRPKLLGEVGRVIAVASGKGGVGKSTVAVNLAVGLAQLGLRVGLLDADVHGPSLPRMLGFSDRRAMLDGDRILPVSAWGISVISMGLLVDEARAMVWRGPMVMGALEQLMGQVAWPALDVMVVDMPPGTGDAQLTLAQRTSLAGAVVVSTPQDIALVDARRGIEMFAQTNVPVLGLVENMSVFCCPGCGQRTAIFGEGGARAEAASRGVPFLGAVPLVMAVREAGDAGAPIVAASPDSEAGVAFRAIAAAVRAAILPI